MFVPCPHCGFLVSLIVSQHGTPQRCPRCNGTLPAESSAVSEPTQSTSAAEDSGTAKLESSSDANDAANAGPDVVSSVDAARAVDADLPESITPVADAPPTKPATRDRATQARTTRTRRSVPS